MIWDAWEQPPEDLPVAANPAVPSQRVGEIAGRMVFVQHHVALQSRATVAALEQVVAEDRVLGKYAAAVLEGIDVVDALADEGPLVEKVLVEVGDDPRVGIDAWGARGEATEMRPLRAWQTHRHTWLDDAMAGHDAGLRGVGHGPVEDVCHGARHLAGRVAGQVGVGVERDDKSHLRQELAVSSHVREASGGAGEGGSAEHGVEIGELAAFAFAAHPDAVASVPCAAAVQQQEGIVAIGWTTPIERIDPGHGLPDQRLVGGERFRRGIGEVGEQGEMQVRIAVGEEADLQAFEESIDRGRVGEHGRHGDEGALIGWDARPEIKPRKRVRPDDERRRPGDQPHGKMQGNQQHGDDEKP